MFTTVSAPLALAVRAAEGGDRPRDLLNPAVWDGIATDGSVRDAPSSVVEEAGGDEVEDLGLVAPAGGAVVAVEALLHPGEEALDTTSRAVPS